MKIKAWCEKVKSLFYQVVGEGEAVPFFFLPVERRDYIRKYVCYSILIAPIILIIRLVLVAFQTVYIELLNVLELWERNLRQKKE